MARKKSRGRSRSVNTNEMQIPGEDMEVEAPILDEPTTLSSLRKRNRMKTEKVYGGSYCKLPSTNAVTGANVFEDLDNYRKQIVSGIRYGGVRDVYQEKKHMKQIEIASEAEVSSKVLAVRDADNGVQEVLVEDSPTTVVKSAGIADYESAAKIPERIKPPSKELAIIKPAELRPPTWHAPWKLMRVIAGHTGWVRCAAIDVSNEWFVTGGNDRTLMIWDLASGQRKVTLTGHIATIRGVTVDPKHPYMFSCGEDGMVKCWDLEYNKVIRHYHGHLSGVYCCSLHPTVDVLVTGGRDATARVWDIRTKSRVHCLSGHNHSVFAVATQPTDPQVISAAVDGQVKLWDLAAGKTMATLTNHKKGVRGLVIHPKEYSFATASADNIKRWQLPQGKFLHNYSGHKSIVNSLCVNSDVMVSAGDNGSMYFWDYSTGYNFQQLQTRVQPGSLESEAGIFSCLFDHTGSRLITCEADKSIKIWKEDETATPETHPIQWKPSLKRKRW